MTKQETTRPSEGAGRNDQPTITPEHTWEAAAERAFAGALLTAAPALTGEILNAAADEDVADPFCRFAVTTARRMHSEGQPIDPVTMAAYARRHNLIGPGPTLTHLASRLFALANDAPVPLSGPYYGRAVVEAAVCRAAVSLAGRLVELSEAGPSALIEAVPGFLTELRSTVARIARPRAAKAVAA